MGDSGACIARQLGSPALAPAPGPGPPSRRGTNSCGRITHSGAIKHADEAVPSWQFNVSEDVVRDYVRLCPSCWEKRRKRLTCLLVGEHQESQGCDWLGVSFASFSLVLLSLEPIEHSSQRRGASLACEKNRTGNGVTRRVTPQTNFSNQVG